jgi:hypothetical protein
MTASIRVELPSSLRVLAGVEREIVVRLHGAATQRALLDAIEAELPMLRGTIRDPVNQLRRPFLRFFACEQDLSHCPPDQTLPTQVIDGSAVFIVLGAIAGG